MDNYHVRNCLQCGKGLSGRLDKRFCDAYCRNTYNNQNKTEGERTIASVNTVLRKNRKILKDLCPIGKATVRKEVLDSLGYDYRYFSGQYKSQKGQTYFICYDYAMSPVYEMKNHIKERVKKVLIVQTQPYFNDYVPDLW